VASTDYNGINFGQGFAIGGQVDSYGESENGRGDYTRKLPSPEMLLVLLQPQ
jgi:hypothetical protein